jgi:hypothetical protein
VAFGVAAARLQGVCGLAESVQLLRVRPRAVAPLPRTAELLVALAGSVDGPLGRLTPGDLVELPEGASKARADAKTGFLGLLVGDEHLYRGLFGWLLP